MKRSLSLTVSSVISLRQVPSVSTRDSTSLRKERPWESKVQVPVLTKYSSTSSPSRLGSQAHSSNLGETRSPAREVLDPQTTKSNLMFSLSSSTDPCSFNKLIFLGICEGSGSDPCLEDFLREWSLEREHCETRMFWRLKLQSCLPACPGQWLSCLQRSLRTVECISHNESSHTLWETRGSSSKREHACRLDIDRFRQLTL